MMAKSLDQINLDYARAVSQAEELEQIAGEIGTLMDDSYDACMGAVRNSWKGENADRCFGKGQQLKMQVLTTEADLRKAAAAIRSIAKSVRDAELREHEETMLPGAAIPLMAPYPLFPPELIFLVIIVILAILLLWQLLRLRKLRRGGAERMRSGQKAANSAHAQNGNNPGMKKGNGCPYLVTVENTFTIEITSSPFAIGTDPEGNDFVFEGNPLVSRHHAAIYSTRNKYYLEDLQSTNGTWINGERIPAGKKTELHGGDRVRFANVTFLFRER